MFNFLVVALFGLLLLVFAHLSPGEQSSVQRVLAALVGIAIFEAAIFAIGCYLADLAARLVDLLRKS